MNQLEFWFLIKFQSCPLECYWNHLRTFFVNFIMICSHTNSISHSEQWDEDDGNAWRKKHHERERDGWRLGWRGWDTWPHTLCHRDLTFILLHLIFCECEMLQKEKRGEDKNGRSFGRNWSFKGQSELVLHLHCSCLSTWSILKNGYYG